MSVFDYSGLASLSDLGSPDWKELFHVLEGRQEEFSRQSHRFRSEGYTWPAKPLYSWSWVWEYPYAYYHLKDFIQASSGTPKVADIGSGVTFMPFSIADLGADVVCADIDPICGVDLPRASTVIRHNGTVSFRAIQEGPLPFADAELDAVYCISVLEHIDAFEQTVREIWRSLKPGGMFLLTFDVAVRGIEGISALRRESLVNELNEQFTISAQERDLPLSEALLSDRGPYPMKDWNTAWYRAKQRIKPLLGRTLIAAPLMAVESMVLLKRAAGEHAQYQA